MSELFVLRDLGGLEMIQVVPDGCDDILVLFDQGRAHSYLSSSLAESHRFTFPAAKGLVGIRFQPVPRPTSWGRIWLRWRGKPFL